jgi:hypothetical protein
MFSVPTTTIEPFELNNNKKREKRKKRKKKKKEKKEETSSKVRVLRICGEKEEECSHWCADISACRQGTRLVQCIPVVSDFLFKSVPHHSQHTFYPTV